MTMETSKWWHVSCSFSMVFISESLDSVGTASCRYAIRCDPKASDVWSWLEELVECMDGLENLQETSRNHTFYTMKSLGGGSMGFLWIFVPSSDDTKIDVYPTSGPILHWWMCQFPKGLNNKKNRPPSGNLTVWYWKWAIYSWFMLICPLMIWWFSTANWLFCHKVSTCRVAVLG